MSELESCLGDHIHVQSDELRLRRQWVAIETRMRTSRGRTRGAWMLATGAGGLAVLAVLCNLTWGSHADPDRSSSNNDQSILLLDQVQLERAAHVHRPAPSNPAEIEPTIELEEHHTGVPARRKRSSHTDIGDADTVFERANEARLAGDAHVAAAEFERFVQRYASDRRAGLAAFELARIRLDVLGDMPGATAALRTAIRLAPHAPFREHVDARLVDVLHAQGDVDGCTQARSEYLARHPRGSHRAVVERRCDAVRK